MKEFKYLGGTISAEGGMGEEVTHMLEEGKKASMGDTRKVLEREHDISRNKKASV